MTLPPNSAAFLRALSWWQPTPEHLPLLVPLTPEEMQQVHAAYLCRFRYRPNPPLRPEADSLLSESDGCSGGAERGDG